MFKLPADLAALSRAELEALLAAAEAEFDQLAAETTADGATVSQENLDRMRELNAASTVLTDQVSTVTAAEDARAAEVQELAAARAARAATPEPVEPEDTPVDNSEDDGGGPAGGSDVVTEAENIAANAATEKEPAVTASTGTPSFKGLGARTGSTPARNAPAPTEIGFQMRGQVPKFIGGHVGFKELAASIESMTTGSRVHANRAPHRNRGHMVPLSLATLDRGFGPEHQINAASGEELERRMTELVAGTEWRPSQFDKDGALVASGGHCAVPETIYTFCDVTPASGLLTLPAANFGPRGGIRRPLDPDFTELYNTLPFRYTEAELEAVNPDGTAVVTKPCIEIPCTEWEEIAVEAIGLCVTAGILQKRGFPEEIERFLKEVTKAHLIKLSIWSILDMIAVSTALTIPSAGSLGAAGAFLNGLALRATLIRQKERIPHDALIEGESPAWVLEVAKADMAIQQGRDVKAITDQEIDGWLNARNIRIQWLQHWQKLPEDSVRWPTSVQVILHPAGAFVQHLENVIEVGTLYDKAMLQKNRYMELFTEDEYAVDKRCRVSEVVTVPLCANGSVGAREAVTCTASTNEVQALTITGSPTGGTFTVTFKGSTTVAIAYNASAATVQAALAALSTIGAGNVAVSGSAGGPYSVTFQGVLGATNQPQMTATGSFTGGTTPAITPSTTTAGAPN